MLVVQEELEALHATRERKIDAERCDHQHELVAWLGDCGGDPEIEIWCGDEQVVDLQVQERLELREVAASRATEIGDAGKHGDA